VGDPASLSHWLGEVAYKQSDHRTLSPALQGGNDDRPGLHRQVEGQYFQALPFRIQFEGRGFDMVVYGG